MKHRLGDPREDPALGFKPFTMELQLCDNDGIVRSGRFFKGIEYPCTTHAHFAGEHIRCTSPAHEPPAGPGPYDYETEGFGGT